MHEDVSQKPEIRLGERDAEVLDALRARLDDLKRGAAEVEPTNWWLQASELTTLGYTHLVLDIARYLDSHTSGSDIRVLDWGGGPGFLSYLLEGLGFQTTYYDFDYDYPAFRYALSRLGGEVRHIEDPVKLPFADGTFDAVVSFGVLEHVPDPSGSLAEISRVLKPGGTLFVYHFPNRRGYIESVAKRLGRPYHDFKLTRREFERLIEDGGFEITSFSCRYLLPRNLTDLPRLREFFSRHARGAYAFDEFLSRLPLVRSVATTLNVVAEKTSP